jgi:hypothetical protein
MVEQRIPIVADGPVRSEQGYDLGRVAMPIIRLMRDGHLSWAQKEECSHLLANLYWEWEQGRKEMQIIGGLTSAAAKLGESQ